MVKHQPTHGPKHLPMHGSSTCPRMASSTLKSPAPSSENSSHKQLSSNVVLQAIATSHLTSLDSLSWEYNNSPKVPSPLHGKLCMLHTVANIISSQVSKMPLPYSPPQEVMLSFSNQTHCHLLF